MAAINRPYKKERAMTEKKILDEEERQAYFQKCFYCIFRDKQGTWCHKYIKSAVGCQEFQKERPYDTASINH